MLKAGELMINNWVQHKNRNGLFTLQVLECLKKGVLVNEKVGEWFLRYEELEGIHISEDILLNCGFKIDGNKSYWMPFDLDRYIQLIYSADGYYPTLVQEAESQYDSPMAFSCDRINHVHQLQNLTLALTGKQLTINLNKYMK